MKNTSDNTNKVETESIDIIELSDGDSEEDIKRESIQNLEKEAADGHADANIDATNTDADDDDDDVEIMIPLSLQMTGTSSGGNDCTLLVQVDPEDVSTLDFHGASGAVGRFEVHEHDVTMDFKGFQYAGVINPGPTALIASMHRPKTGKNIMKVEALTDEFITLQKTADSMAQLDAIIEYQGDDQGDNQVEIDIYIDADITTKPDSNSNNSKGEKSSSYGTETAKKRGGKNKSVHTSTASTSRRRRRK